MPSTTSQHIEDVKSNVTKQMKEVDSQARNVLSDIKSKSNAKVTPILTKAQENAKLLWNQYYEFSSDSPVVSGFLTIQLLLAAIPLGIFASFMIGTIVTFTVIGAVVAGTIIFFAGCVLASVLLVTSTIGFGIFVWATSVYLSLKWFQSIRNFGVKQGTRQFLFGVERQVKQELDEVQVYALRAEDKFTAQTKLEDIVPGMHNAA